MSNKKKINTIQFSVIAQNQPLPTWWVFAITFFDSTFYFQYSRKGNLFLIPFRKLFNDFLLKMKMRDFWVTIQDLVVQILWKEKEKRQVIMKLKILLLKIIVCGIFTACVPYLLMSLFFAAYNVATIELIDHRWIYSIAQTRFYV